MNLNTPSIDPGPLTAADLDCKTNTGRIYHLHRATLAPAGCDNQGRTEARQWPGTDQPMAAEACNETDDDIRPHSAAAARFWTRYLLVLLVACAAGIAAWLR